MESQENWLPALSLRQFPHRSQGVKGLGEKKERRGNQNTLCISVASFELRKDFLARASIQNLVSMATPCSLQAVMAHSGASVAEPENGIGEVLFPGLLALPG